MKKKLLGFLLAAVVLCGVPTYAYAVNRESGSDNFKEVITNQKVITKTNEDGTVSQVGLVTIEHQPSEEIIARAGCSTGQHTVVSNGPADVTRIHGNVHPGYCTLRTVTYWRCIKCTTTGSDEEYTLVWCPSRDTVDSVGEEGAGPI